MLPIIASSLIAFLVCVLLVPRVRAFAISRNLYDKPGKLKIHHVATPRLGGIAMMAGLAAGTFFFLQGINGQSAVAVMVLVAVWLLGLADDLWNMPSILRLAAHLTLGVILWAANWQLHWFASSAFDLMATATMFAFLINVMNLLDGVDGLVLSVNSVIAIGFIVLSFSASAEFSTWLASILLAICLGALIHNYPPARIFIGDSGSTLLGAIIAILCLDWVRVAPESHSALLPLIFVSLPAGDVIVAMIRRVRACKSPFDGDRRHFYDLLLQKGWSVRAVLVISSVLTAALVVTAWLCFWGTLEISLTIGSLFAALSVTAYFLGSFRPDYITYQSGTDISPARNIV